MVMQNLYNRQYGAAYGTPQFATAAYGGTSVGAGVTLGANLSATASTGSAQVSGFVVVVFLALAWIGYHGLKG